MILVSEKSKKNLRPVKKGEVRNPTGTNGRDGTLTKDNVSQLISKFASKTREELHAVVQDPASTAIQITVASILAQAMKSGDYTRLEFLLTRSIGRVKEEIELSKAQSFILRKRDGEEIHMGVQEVKVIEGEKE